MTRTAEQRAIISQADAIRRGERRAAKAQRRGRVQPTAEGQRRPRVRDNGFLAYTRRLPCAVGPVGCEGPVQAAHIRTPRPGEPPTGMGRKPNDDRVNPLCARHHAEQHSMNEMAFWRKYGRDPYAIAARNFEAYRGGDA